jgi:hypothetical protein
MKIEHPELVEQLEGGAAAEAPTPKE